MKMHQLIVGRDSTELNGLGMIGSPDERVFLDDSTALTCSNAKFIAVLKMPACISTAVNLATVAQHAAVTSVVDHFYHAELLSQAFSQTSFQVSVLIALNAGTDCVGVRPGYDALRLAQAMQELKGLNVIGLATNLTRQQNNELAETVSAIRHTENLLTQNSLAVSRVMLCDFALSHSTDSLIRTGATDLILYDGRDMGRTDLAVGPSNPAGNATVISRPSLSTAVIDIGRFSLWPDAGPVCVRVTRPQGATVLQIDEFTTALGLAGNALDLRIGDQLEWKVEHSDWILKPNSY